MITSGSVNMTNITISGSYYNGQGYGGCLIGLIQSGASTNLTNGSIDDAYFYSMMDTGAPVYGV